MNESYITVSTEYVVRLAKQRLTQLQCEAEDEFKKHIDDMVTQANLKIQIRHDKCETRKKSFLRFLMPKSWVECPPFRYAEEVREEILTDFKSVDHPAYRLEFHKPYLLASIVDDPSETWPTLWNLANINVNGIKHGNKI